MLKKHNRAKHNRDLETSLQCTRCILVENEASVLLLMHSTYENALKVKG